MDRLDAKLNAAPHPVVLFDLEGHDLGLPRSETDLVSVAIAGFATGRDSCSAFDVLGDCEGVDEVYVLDINRAHGGGRAADRVREWLTRRDRIWVGWGIRNDLAALAMHYGTHAPPKDALPLFLDLQIPVSPSFGDGASPDDGPVDWAARNNLMGLARFLGEEEGREKVEFKRNIRREMARRGRSVSFVSRPLHAHSPSIVYAHRDISTILLAARRVVDSAPDTAAMTEAWTARMVRDFFDTNGPAVIAACQVGFARRAIQIALVPANKRQSALRRQFDKEASKSRAKAVDYLFNVLRHLIHLESCYEYVRGDAIKNLTLARISYAIRDACTVILDICPTAI